MRLSKIEVLRHRLYQINHGILKPPLWIRWSHFMIFHDRHRWEIEGVAILYCRWLPVLPSRCHQMSWNFFQFNMVTFEDMSWHYHDVVNLIQIHIFKNILLFQWKRGPKIYFPKRRAGLLGSMPSYVWQQQRPVTAWCNLSVFAC